MGWTVLGFDYDAIMERWEDARFAQALEEAWVRAGRPPQVEAYVSAATDEFPFRFWLNEAAATLLEGPHLSWQARVIGKAHAPPRHARSILPVS